MQNSHLQVEKGEFYCPLCRQFSNCVLPLIPDIVEKSFIRSNVETNFDRSCEELMRLLEEPNESSLVISFQPRNFSFEEKKINFFFLLS